MKLRENQQQQKNAILILDLTFFQVIYSFQDISGWKLRKIVWNRKRTQKGNSDETEYPTEKYLDFFNKERQFLSSYKLLEGYSLNTIDLDRRFYFIQWNPFPRVIRSRLKLN